VWILTVLGAMALVVTAAAASAWAADTTVTFSVQGAQLTVTAPTNASLPGTGITYGRSSSSRTR